VGGGGTATNHNALAGLQGGDDEEYYHLDAVRYSWVTNAAESAMLTEAAASNLFVDLGAEDNGQWWFERDGGDVRFYGDVTFADSVTLGGEIRTNWPEAGSGGGGWTNLSFSGTGNVITSATATATTLTLQRGEVEGGGGGSATPTVEGDVLVHPFASSITLAGGTNLWQQRISEITDACTITPPAKASTNVAAQIWLSVPAIGANAVGWWPTICARWPERRAH
jgi:hypothetical protein